MARPDVKQQATELRKAEEVTARVGLVEGDTYYAVSQEWWQALMGFLEGAGPDPEMVDNTEIVDASGRALKESGLTEGKDFTLKHESVWQLVWDWYGATNTISCKAVRNEKGEVYVDLFPIHFELWAVGLDGGAEASGKQKRVAPKEIMLVPRAERLASLRPLVESELKGRLDGLETRLWVCEGTSETFNLLKDDVMEEQIKDVLTGLGMWKLLVEAKPRGAPTWPYAEAVGSPEPGSDSADEVRALRRRAVSFVREAPEVGQRVDARRKADGLWHEGVVVKVDESPEAAAAAAQDNPAADGDASAVVVHFLSFDDAQDEVYQAGDEASLQPPYTRVPDWREQLRKGEEVEVRRSALGSAAPVGLAKGPWLIGKVKRFNRASAGSNSTPGAARDGEEETDDDMSSSPSPGGPVRHSLATKPKRKRAALTSPQRFVASGGKEVKAVSSRAAGRGMVLVEVRTGTYLSQRKEVWLDLDSEDIAQRYTHTTKPKPSYGPQGVKEAPKQSGVVGLRNLGNTCFMNSMLQCLSFTIPLTEFFLRGDYETDLNRKNPLGTGGKLAEAYASLLHDLWSDQFSVVAPTDFKQQLGRAFTQFQGYQQQDSHELFSLLVDGLHEDLNRIKKKPYTEAVESKGRPDHEVARESWDTFRQRNDSVIVDTMMGLLRSHLTCPRCKTEAIKFDAYSNWSVPIPKKTTTPFHVVLFPQVAPGEAPQLRRFVVHLQRTAAGRDAADAVAQLTGVPRQHLFLISVHDNKPDVTVFSPTEDEAARTSYSRCSNSLDSAVRDHGDIIAIELTRAAGPPAAENGTHPPAAPSACLDPDTFVELRFLKEPYSTSAFRLSDYLAVEDGVSTQDLHRMVWDKVRFMFRDEYSPPASFLETGLDGPYTLRTRTNTPVPHDDAPWSRSKVLHVEFNGTGLRGLQGKYLPSSSTSIRLRVSQSLTERDDELGLGEVAHDATVTEFEAAARGGGGARGGIDLKKCMDKFREEEQLGENDEWFCPECKELVRAFKQMDLWTAPEILTVHLKRFYYERNRYIRSWVDREKIGDLVRFPLKGLDLSSYLQGWEPDSGEPEPIYDLYAVSNHIGGMGGGHYTAYVKHAETGDWHLMDDSRCSPATPESVISSQAYVLFYKRRS